MLLSFCHVCCFRYLGISKPLTYPVRRSGKCMAKIVLSVWLFSASITLPPLFGWAQNISDENVCLISQDLGYTVYSTAVAFYIPMCVMLIMYYRIYRAVKMSVAKHAITFPSRPDDGVSYVSAVLKLQREVKERAIITRLLRNERKYVSMFKREQKAATTLGVMVRAFSVCWLPFFCCPRCGPLSVVCTAAVACPCGWREPCCGWAIPTTSLTPLLTHSSTEISGPPTRTLFTETSTASS